MNDVDQEGFTKGWHKMKKTCVFNGAKRGKRRGGYGHGIAGK